MPGLAIRKGQPDVVALADDEYPAWLWELADENAAGSSGAPAKGKKSKRAAEAEAASLSPEERFKQEKKELRKAGKAAIKASNQLKG